MTFSLSKNAGRYNRCANRYASRPKMNATFCTSRVARTRQQCPATIAVSGSFSGHASGYATARPHYPDALFMWLAQQCARALAWDAGCGNGGRRRARWLCISCRCTPSDPSAEQIGLQTAPNIRYAVEPAEQCSLDDASADLVTSRRAMHWFDVPRFRPSTARAQTRWRVRGMDVCAVAR